MKALAIVVGLVAILAVAAELVAPSFVESRVERTVRDHVPEVAAVEADAGGFPFLPTLLREGIVESLTVTLDEVGGRQVTLATVSLGLEGIRVERAALLRGEVNVLHIATGIGVVEIGEEQLTEALGISVDLDALEVRDDVLELAGGAAPEVPLPTDLLPCDPSTEVVDGRIRMSCEVTRVPEVLVRAAQG